MLPVIVGVLAHHHRGVAVIWGVASSYEQNMNLGKNDSLRIFAASGLWPGSQRLGREGLWITCGRAFPAEKRALSAGSPRGAGLIKK